MTTGQSSPVTLGKVSNKMMDYQIAKQNIDHFLKIDEEEQKREQQNTGHR